MTFDRAKLIQKLEESEAAVFTIDGVQVAKHYAELLINNRHRFVEIINPEADVIELWDGDNNLLERTTVRW